MDIRLHYAEKGEGTPLIFLHGNGENLKYFENQFSYFSKKYHVIALDTRGHGESPRGTAPFTISQFAEDLRAFMDMHSIEKAHILGFSDGGNIALTFALKYPERVDRLILNGANLDPSGIKPVFQVPIVMGYHAARFALGLLRRGGLKSGGEGPETEAGRAHRRTMGKRGPLKQKVEMLGLMVNDPHIPVEALADLFVRTLVIAGTKDMVKDSHTRRICGALPNAKLVLISGDHFIAAKRWEEFNREVESFLEEPLSPAESIEDSKCSPPPSGENV